MMIGGGSLSAVPAEATTTTQAASSSVECAHPLPWHHLLAASALGSLIGGVGVLLIERGLKR